MLPVTTKIFLCQAYKPSDSTHNLIHAYGHKSLKKTASESWIIKISMISLRNITDHDHYGSSLIHYRLKFTSESKRRVSFPVKAQYHKQNNCSMTNFTSCQGEYFIYSFTLREVSPCESNIFASQAQKILFKIVISL